MASADLPCAIEVEQSVIGKILVDASTIEKNAEHIDPEIFYDPLHQRLVAAAIARWSDGKSVTPLMMAAILEGDPSLVELGGVSYLQNLARAAPPGLSIKDACAILRDRAMRRSVIAVGENLVAMASTVEEDDPAVNIARRGAEALCDIGTAADLRPPRVMAEVEYESLRRIERAFRGEKPPRISTGLAELDRHLGGFMAGDLIVAPGRPGMGKSALAAGIALRTALSGCPTLVFSLEMTAEQWADRNTCDLDFDTADPKDPLWYEEFRRASLNGPRIERATLAAQRLTGLSYEILDDDRLTIEDITARSRAFRARFPAATIGLIVIDYLQIVPVTYRRDRTREQEVRHIVRGAKSLAKQMGWPVLAMAQLSRDADKRGEEHRRPTLSDIRESGSIEAEADVVLAPYRPAYYVELKRPGSDAGDGAFANWNNELTPVKNKFELLCRKNRHGRTFDAHLWCEIGSNAIRDSEPLPQRVAWFGEESA